MELYMQTLHLDTDRISSEIDQLLRSQSLTTELSIFVDLRVYSSGEYTLVVDSISLYDGYSLRAITPRAVLVEFTSPFGSLPTNARRTTVAQANDVAVNLGGELAVEHIDNRVISIGGSAPFVVLGRMLVTPQTLESVEREVVIEAAERAGLTIEQRDITISELLNCDELFITDHYGLTSISHLEHRPYANTIAVKVAELLAQPF